jgi:hypothetical protein
VIHPQVPKKKLIQSGLYGEEILYLPLNLVSSKLRPTIADPPKLRPTKGKLLPKLAKGNKKDTKTTKSKKNTGKAKHSAFHNGQDDCKESVKLAKTLH